MTSIDLVILGLIKRNPQSAYDLQKTLEYRNISRWVKISTPSIYKKVLRLEEQGYLTGRVEQGGKMPNKTIYSITDSGEVYFLNLMEENAGNAVSVMLDFNAVIMNLGLVPDDKKEELLDRVEGGIHDMRIRFDENRQGKSEAAMTGRTFLEQQYGVATALQNWMELFRESRTVESEADILM